MYVGHIWYLYELNTYTCDTNIFATSGYTCIVTQRMSFAFILVFLGQSTWYWEGIVNHKLHDLFPSFCVNTYVFFNCLFRVIVYRFILQKEFAWFDKQV